jgi:hypothetical protein
MTDPSPTPRRPRFRARYLLALLYVAAAAILVWMISRPTPVERPPARSAVQATDAGARTPAAMGRRPEAPAAR